MYKKSSIRYPVLDIKHQTSSIRYQVFIQINNILIFETFLLSITQSTTLTSPTKAPAPKSK